MARKVVRPSYMGGPATIVDEEDEEDLYYDPKNPDHVLSTPASRSHDQSPSVNSSPASATNSFSDKENTPQEPRRRGSHTSPLVKRERSLINHSARSTPYAIPSSNMSAALRTSKGSAVPKSPLSKASKASAAKSRGSRAASRVAETPAPDDRDDEEDPDTPSTAYEQEEELMNDRETSPEATQRSRVSETPGPSRRSRQPLQSQVPSATQPPSSTQRPASTEFYDPDQSMAERRRVKGAYNEIQQELIDNKAQFLKAGNRDLIHYLEKTSELFNDVKQTSDAVVDARIQVDIGKLAAEKAKRVGNSATNTGLEIDEFIAKCIQFMSKSRPGDTSDGHDWAYLGSQVATPSLKRACPSDFMYGPMAIQKRQRLLKERKRVVRRRPEEFIRPIDLDEKQIAKNENSTTKNVLMVERALENYIRQTGEEHINYFSFVINPHSYSQTIENMFYLAFLVRDCRVGLFEDDDGLLWLALAESPSPEEAAAQGCVRKQIVMPMEKYIWRELIDAFQIKDTVIPMRQREVEAINASGWYS
ncbi:nuclear protein [Orbilia brochopaga]|uniref:Non-structural maintenance of chromosomes element 4 n=1 Tax=Orbilia brochopaga TaxID=3140254 RepID=A0AAV9U9D8_9PEZI